MMRNGNRTIKVKKKELLEKVKANKEKHVKEYEKAVIAYKLEALEQLNTLMVEAEKGERQLRLNLVEPVDNSNNYDKIIKMFEWEVEDLVELSQDEFTEYILDENSFAERAFLSNSSYIGKWG